MVFQSLRHAFSASPSINSTVVSLVSKTLSNLQETRLLMLIEGVLAANIFDWGSRACVDLYHKGTIIEIYRMSRNKMQRPWRVREAGWGKEYL